MFTFGYSGEASLPALQCWAFLCLCTITISGVRGFKVLIFSEKCNNFSEYTVWVIRRYSPIECYMYIPSPQTSNLMHPFVHICTNVHSLHCNKWLIWYICLPICPVWSVIIVCVYVCGCWFALKTSSIDFAFQHSVHQ